MLPVQVNRKRFWRAALAAAAVTVWYPIVALIELPAVHAWRLLGQDVTWSVYCLVGIPAGFGLLATVFEPDVFRKMSVRTRAGLGAIFVAIFAVIGFAILDDAGGAPTPDRIAAGPARDAAFDIDSCIRKADCAKPDVSGLGPECVKRNEQAYRIPASATLKHIYACELERRTATEPHKLPKSKLAHVALALNVVLILYIWSFIWISALYFINAATELGEGVLNVLIGCFIILVTWFPLRIYADWYLWYGELSHLATYFAFFVLAAFSAMLFGLYVVWVMKDRAGVKLGDAITGVYGAMVTLFTAFGALAPGKVLWVFERAAAMPWPYYVTLLSLIPGTIALYVMALLRQQQ